MKHFIKSIKILHPISFVVILLALGSTTLRAGDYTWTNSTTANWNTASAWSPTAPASGPTVSDNVIGTPGSNLQLAAASHSISNFTVTTTTNASWALQSGATVASTLNVLGTFTMNSDKIVFVQRNSGGTTGTLSVNAGNFSVVNTNGSLLLGNTGEASALHSVSVSGATTVNAGTRMRMNVTNSANLGALTANGLVSIVTTTNDNISRTVSVTSLSGSGQVNGNASSGLNSSATLIINGASTTTFSGVIANGNNNSVVSLTKNGSGVQRLTGTNNTYTGATTINAGTLMVDGSITSSSAVMNGGLLIVNGTSGGVTVNSGGTLGGSGTVGAVTLINGSFLKPGNSPGLLTAASSTWAAGSTYQWEIDNATGAAGANWDLFSVTGALDMSALSSSSKMNLVLESLSLSNYSTTAPFSWVIAQAGSFTGTGLADGTNVTDLFNINATAFNSGNLPTNGFKVEVGTSGSLRTLNLMAIPEPSTHALLLLASTGLGVYQLSRRGRS